MLYVYIYILTSIIIFYNLYMTFYLEMIFVVLQTRKIHMENPCVVWMSCHPRGCWNGGTTVGLFNDAAAGGRLGHPPKGSEFSKGICPTQSGLAPPKFNINPEK